MSPEEIEFLYRFEWFLEQEAAGLKLLANSDTRDLQEAAVRRLPKYQYAVEVYLQHCNALGKTPNLPALPDSLELANPELPE